MRLTFEQSNKPPQRLKDSTTPSIASARYTGSNVEYEAGWASKVLNS